MYDDELARIRGFSKNEVGDSSSDKKIKNMMRTRLDKVDHLQLLLNSLSSGEVSKKEFPYFPSNMVEFCRWEDAEVGLKAFGRTSFVQKRITARKILETERLYVYGISLKLMNKLEKAKVSSPSATETVKKLREEKTILAQDKTHLVSQLMELKVENSSLIKRLNSYAMQIESLEGKLRSQKAAKVHRIGD
jgi:hypothetical protein